MAIIYSYPETTQILLTDMLIGTSTIRVAGKKKNLTKNFTIETLGGFIHDNFPTQWGEINGTLSNQTDLQEALDSKQSNITLTTIGTSGLSTFIDSVLNIPNYAANIPTKTSDLINDGEDGIHPFITAEDIPPSASTLNDVLTNGNSSLLKANIGELGLWDLEGPAYSTLKTFDHNFIFEDYSGNTAISFEQGILNINKSNLIAGSFSTNLLTASRGYNLPNAAGTIALTSDIPSALIFTSPLVDTLGTITIDQSNTTTDGYLSSTDWNTFNNKQGTITLTTVGSSGNATFIANTLNIPNYSTDLSGYVPYIGATSNVNLGIYDITASHLIKDGGTSSQFLKADGSIDNNVYLTSADLPSTLDLFATTYTSDVPGYVVLVRNILDPRYNTVAVDVPTGAITTTNQLLATLITDTNIISGNPGVFNFTTVGNIQRLSGTGQAEFYFRIYKRDSLGVETFITQSNNTLPVLNTGYAEFSATALWNDGVFLTSDRIVLKYYGSRLASPVGSTPYFQFQFGGLTPVRSVAAVPVAVLPNIYLSNLADVEDVAPLPNEVLYWNNTANLWEHSLVIDLLSPASSSQNGYLNSTDWSIFNGKQNALTNPITGTGTIGTIPKFNGSTTSLSDSTIIQLANGDITINGIRAGLGLASVAQNTVFGYQSGNAITTGNYNTLMGYQSGLLITTGSFNTAIGRLAGDAITTSNLNTLIGNAAGHAITTGTGQNTFIGASTGIATTTGNSNTAVGQVALQSNLVGNFNTAIGTSALNKTTTDYNTAVGYNSGFNITTSSQNALLGYESLSNNTTGNYNVAIGSSAGRFISGLSTANVLCGSSIFIGALTQALANNQTNQIVIGHSAVGLGSNSVVLGNDSITKTALKGQIAIGTTSPVTTAKVQIDSTTQGFLPPRMTTAQMNAIVSPAVGLTIYNTDLSTICFYTTAWQKVTSTAV